MMNNPKISLDRSQACILVVDDDETARQSLAEILRLEGYQVEQSANAVQAIELMSQRAVEIILLDLRMPLEDDTPIPGISEKESGLLVLRYAADNAPDTPVIFLTAHGSMETAIEALRYKAADYLLKPATPDQILKALDSALSHQQQEIRQRSQVTAMQLTKAIADDLTKSLDKLEYSLKALKETDELVFQSSSRDPRLSTPTQETGTGNIESAVKSLNQPIMMQNQKGISINLQRREIRQDIVHTDGNSIQGLRISLTPTEAKLMQVFVNNPGVVFTQQEIVALVHGFDANPQEAPTLLRPLISRLRKKLSSLPNGEKWIRSIRGIGYVFEKPLEQQTMD